MGMGRRKDREKQQDLWVAASEIVTTPGHVFYERLNAVLNAEKFDQRVENMCRKYYKSSSGRPSITPGTYFRLLLVGYFESLDSERGIAWRAADSLSVRKFLGYDLSEPTPDHSTVSRTRRLYSLETHRAVMRWVLGILRKHRLANGQSVCIDATTLQANASMKSLVRRDTRDKPTKITCDSWHRPKGTSSRLKSSWRGWIGSARRRPATMIGPIPTTRRRASRR